MIPRARTLIDGADRTAVFEDRLVSIRITDEQGMTADRCEIEITDERGVVAIPPVGVELRVALGYRDAGLMEMGVYRVDGVSCEGPVRRMTISATAADMTAGLKAPKTRSWVGKSVADIVRAIAAEHGMRASIEASKAAVSVLAEVQQGESDMHFLTRLGHKIGATIKPVGGAIVVVLPGRMQTASGVPVPVVDLDIHALDRWSWDRRDREAYASVRARWTDRDGGATRVVEVGAGEPARELRHPYASEDEARRAAQSALDASKLNRGSLSLDLHGFRGDLMAEGAVRVSGLKTEIDGLWPVRRVEHTLDGSGLRTRAECNHEIEE